MLVFSGSWGTWLHEMEVTVGYRAKWRVKLVNPNCKVLCHAMSTDISGLTLWPSTGGTQISKNEMFFYGGWLVAREERFSYPIAWL